ECGCKCGESIATLGAFFIAAAGAFWLVGRTWLEPGFGLATELGDLTYHQFNMFWFYLGGITVAVGIVYALYARKGSAFAREPADQPEDEEGKLTVSEVSAFNTCFLIRSPAMSKKSTSALKEKPAAAPTPYVMLPAEP
ncbi:Uncharacterized protein SCF082_LOCUS13117, partial [Durusdinium trenchii]